MFRLVIFWGLLASFSTFLWALDNGSYMRRRKTNDVEEHRNKKDQLFDLICDLDINSKIYEELEVEAQKLPRIFNLEDQIPDSNLIPDILNKIQIEKITCCGGWCRVPFDKKFNKFMNRVPDILDIFYGVGTTKRDDAELRWKAHRHEYFIDFPPRWHANNKQGVKNCLTNSLYCLFYSTTGSIACCACGCATLTWLFRL